MRAKLDPLKKRLWVALGRSVSELALQIQRALGVKVSFRQIMERYPSVAALVEMLEPQVTTPEAAPAPKPAAAPTDDEAHTRYDVKKAFGAIARIHTRTDELDPTQRAHLDDLIRRPACTPGAGNSALERPCDKQLATEPSSG